jgi:hypothetical protein
MKVAALAAGVRRYMMRAKKEGSMPTRNAVSLFVLLVVALPSAMAEWKSIRRDKEVMLSVDTESIKRKGDEASLKYMVDFRAPQGDAKDGTPYRSIVVSAKLRCKPKAIALLHTDAYALYGAQGIIIAKTKATAAESSFRPLEVDSSDEDLWRYVCEDKSDAAAKDAPKKDAAKKDAAKKDAPKK